MPNWVTTDYLLFGNTNTLREVGEKIKKGYYGNYQHIGKEFGNAEVDKEYDVRDTVEDCELLEYSDEVMLQITTSTANSYSHGLIDFICAKYGLNYIFFSENAADELYVTNDYKGRYFPDRYIVSQFNGECWHVTYEQAVADLIDRIGVKYLAWKVEDAVDDYNSKHTDDYVSFIEVKLV